MRRITLHVGFADKASLLLHLAAALLMCQLVLWVTSQQAMDVKTRRAAVSTADERTSERVAPPFRLQSHGRTSRVFANDPGRYYDPGLANVAEHLDAESRYFVAMALEDCYALSHDGLPQFRDDFVRRLNTGATATNRVDNWARERAFENSIRRCAVFDTAPISPDKILGLLQSAARDGDPRAIARTLLFRDLADSKVGTFDLITRLLSSGDPHVIRDVGLFLTRGESSMVIGDGGVPVSATSLAVAWELVACDFGMDCGSDSKLLNNLCAYQGQCGAFSYEDWLGRYTESTDELQEIRRLRMLLRHGLIAQDWQFLGLHALKTSSSSLSPLHLQPSTATEVFAPPPPENPDPR